MGELVDDIVQSVPQIGGSAAAAPTVTPETIKSASGLDSIMDGVSNVLDFVGTILEAIVQNEVLCFLLAAGFVSVGILVFSKLKRSAKR